MCFELHEFRRKIFSCHVKIVNERICFYAVGRTGWHIEGLFRPAPFPYSLYHMVCVPLKSDTVFAPLNEIVDNPHRTRETSGKDCG